MTPLPILVPRAYYLTLDMQLKGPGMAGELKDLIQLCHFEGMLKLRNCFSEAFLTQNILFDYDQYLNAKSISKTPHILTLAYFIASRVVSTVNRGLK